MTWLKNCNLVDVRDGSIRRGVSVQVTDGRISQITESNVTPDADAIDLGGRYLLPGLISVHNHLSVFYPFIATTRQTRSDRAELSRARDAAGVTTIRCVHEQNRADLLIGRRPRGWWAPRILGAGRAISPLVDMVTGWPPPRRRLRRLPAAPESWPPARQDLHYRRSPRREDAGRANDGCARWAEGTPPRGVPESASAIGSAHRRR